MTETLQFDRIVTYLQDHLLTWILVLLMASFFVWLLRLHFDPKYQKFDLMKLIEQPDGSPDGEKIRVWSTYVAGFFGFLLLLAHDHAAFLAYAPTFMGITFAHLVANRVTSKPLTPQQPVIRPGGNRNHDEPK